MKRCFMWDAAQPFVISHLECCNIHQAGLVKYSVQQNAAACPAVNLPKFSLRSPPPPHSSSSLATGGCSHRILNSGPGAQGSSGSRASISAGCGLSKLTSLCFVLCYNWPLSSLLPAAASSSFHLALTSSSFFLFFLLLLFPNSKMSFLLQAGKQNCSISCVVKYSLEYLDSSLTLKTTLIPICLNFFLIIIFSKSLSDI